MRSATALSPLSLINLSKFDGGPEDFISLRRGVTALLPLSLIILSEYDGGTEDFISLCGGTTALLLLSLFILSEYDRGPEDFICGVATTFLPSVVSFNMPKIFSNPAGATAL